MTPLQLLACTKKASTKTLHFSSFISVKKKKMHVYHLQKKGDGNSLPLGLSAQYGLATLLHEPLGGGGGAADT